MVFLAYPILFARPTFQHGYKKSTPGAGFQTHYSTEISGKKNRKEVKSSSYIVGPELGSPARSYGKSGSPTRSFGGSGSLTRSSGESGRKTVTQIVEIIK